MVRDGSCDGYIMVNDGCYWLMILRWLVNDGCHFHHVAIG